MTTNTSYPHFSLLHTDYVELDAKWDFPHVISPYYRIYYISSGEGWINSQHGKVKLEAGWLYLIPSFTLCHLHCNQQLHQHFLQFFEETPGGVPLFGHHRKVMRLPATAADVVLFERLLTLNPGRGISGSDNPRAYEKDAVYRQYQALNLRQPLHTGMETQGIILQLVARFLAEEAGQEATAPPIPSRILEVIRYIQLHLHRNLTVKQLAGQAALHPDYFSRLFREHTGERPAGYLQQKRVERAQYLMATTALTLEEIALRSGFESLSYFNRVFRKITQQTPGQYRYRNFLVQ
jgi:AraC-like DNA-binding protein